MKRNLILLLLLLNYIGYAQTKAPLSYVAYQTKMPLKIDGVANEKAWQKTLFTNLFIDIEGKKQPTYNTKVKMLWDDTYFYVYAQMEEPHVWATLKQRDTVIFYNNDFEIFIDPDGDTHNYYEFEMNALNTVWDLFITKPYREPAPIIDSWDIQGLKTAVHIDGTLNNPLDTDKGWSVEVAIPWKVLEEAATHRGVPKNEFWRINFSRVNWDFELKDGKYARKKDSKGKYLPEYNWVWSPQAVINMHEPEKWGYVFFSDKEVGSKVSFSIPDEEKIRWYLYELYRKVKKGTPLKQLVNLPLNYNGKQLTPTVEKHSLGWNIIIRNNNVRYMIREDGKFYKKKK